MPPGAEGSTTDAVRCACCARSPPDARASRCRAGGQPSRPAADLPVPWLL